MLTIAICEDDLKQQRELEERIADMDLKEAIDLCKFNYGEELLQDYEAGKRFSIILLDMQMNVLDGIQTAKLVREMDENCIIIIITSIIEYAVEGYSIDAFDFILKPVDKEKFNMVLTKAIKEIQANAKKVYVIQTREKLLGLRMSTISYIESYKKSVIVHAEDKTYMNNENISNTEKKLKNDGFIRISRYYLVNVSHIKQIGVKTLILTSGEALNYSIKCRDSIKKEYMNFMMGGM